MNKYKNFIQNIGLFAINALATRLITFLLIPLYTYHLSESDYGITDMSQTVTFLIAPVATLSISDAVLRYIIDDRKNTEAYFYCGLLVTTVSCIVVFFSLPLLQLGIFGGLDQFRYFFYFSYVATAFASLCGNVARAVDQVRILVLSSLVSVLVSTGGAVVMIATLHLGITGYFYSSILGQLVGIVILFFMGKQYSLLTKPSALQIQEAMRRLLPYAVPLIPNALFWWISASVNRLFITGLLGIAASGLFAAAGKIPNVLNMVYSVFLQAWTLSSFREFRNSDREGFFAVVLTVLYSLLSITTSGLIIAAPWIASLLLQKEFYHAWPLTPILIIAVFFNALGSFFGTIFTTALKTRQIVLTTFAASCVSIIATPLFIHLMGLRGAGYALVLSNLVLVMLRIIAAQAITRFTISWVPTTLTAVILFTQMFLVSTQASHYLPIALTLFCVLAAIQLRRLYPILKRTRSIFHLPRRDD